MRNVMYRNSLQSFATNSFKRTNTQFLCFLRAPRGDGTQDRNQWNEPPGAETEWSSKSELVPLSFAYPSPGPKGSGYNWPLHLLWTSNWLSLAVFFGAGEGGCFWQRALKHSVLDSKTAIDARLNSFKFQKCHTISKYVRKRRLWQIYKVAV